ncbi:hypothetical protein [Streptomyces sp. NPDC059742]|uniref:hypothetical protein n=1 Tax=Streptomyces sp. NPDC059742 TaxID=3346927 RepID=UPI0036506FDD
MIDIAPQQLPALIRWFPSGSPGLGALAEHVLTTGTGHWWADHADRPRVLAVTCADHVLMRGDPARSLRTPWPGSRTSTSRRRHGSGPPSAPPSNASSPGNGCCTSTSPRPRCPSPVRRAA